MTTIEAWKAVPFHFWTGVFFVFGCITGSFLNVCIHRMPLGESIAGSCKGKPGNAKTFGARCKAAAVMAFPRFRCVGTRRVRAVHRARRLLRRLKNYPVTFEPRRKGDAPTGCQPAIGAHFGDDATAVVNPVGRVSFLVDLAGMARLSQRMTSFMDRPSEVRR